MSDEIHGFMCGRGGRKKPQPVPPLADRQMAPLSATLTGPRRPDTCQACSATDANAFDAERPLGVWEESDEWDRWQTPPVHVILCADCSKRLIDPHPRLYRARDRWAPNLGAMALCTGCALRDGIHCRAELAKMNGGSGMEVRYDDPQPVRFHVKASGFSGYRWLFKGPVIYCAGRTE